MNYHPLTPETMPPIDISNYFILWRGVRDTDGGFPVTAKRVQYSGMPAYIRYVSPQGWKRLETAEYADCLWAEIQEPKETTYKYACRKSPPGPTLIPERGLKDRQVRHFNTADGRPAWGWAAYARELTDEETEEYGMERIE